MFFYFFSEFICSGVDIMLGTVTSVKFIFFFKNLIRSALVKMPMYSSACFMGNTSRPYDEISFDDSSILAEEWIEWGCCVTFEI